MKYETYFIFAFIIIPLSLVVKQNMNAFSYFFEIIFIAFFGSLCYNVLNMSTHVRQPQQERSIEKKNRIIEAGYELFSEIGYYGTNTQEIAKRAGVSTGIVYGYFKDKRDILICVLEIYIRKVTKPLMVVMKDLKCKDDLDKVVPEILDATIKAHESNARLHNTLHSIAPTDEAVNSAFISLENHISQKITGLLASVGIVCDHPNEKVHLAMNLVQSFAHEYVFDNHDYIDYEVMRKIVSATIVNLFR